MKHILQYSGIGILFIFMTAYLSSCRNNESVVDNHIEFDSIQVEKTYHVDNDSTRPSCNLKINFVYPSDYEDKAILDSLQQLFVFGLLNDDTYGYYSPKEALNKYEKDYVENYKRDVEIFFDEKLEQEESDKYFSYYETIRNEIKYNQNNILSFQVIQTNYKGGTDSYEFYRNYSIDLMTGQRIMENDIFDSGFESELSSMFKSHLLESNKVKSIPELENLGYFGIDEIIPNGNILLDKNGVTYTFNKGEYSAYKLDPIHIFIPYKDISFLIKEDSPVI